ncbi:hypothetical protein HQ520_18375 [bacterium]|nr:hypothetical protein [bacterium]
MNTRERFQAIFNFQPFDRLPILEWASWWDKTLERWYAEGLPQSLTDRYDICKYFDLDLCKYDASFRSRAPGCPRPSHHGAGIIADERDYQRLLPLLHPEEPVNHELWTRWADEQSRGESVVWYSVGGFFWEPRSLLGIEPHLFAFYEQPDLMHRINSDQAEWILKVTEDLCAICTPDFMVFAEDMSYNHGPMLSKDLFDEFLKPYYQRVIPELNRRGIPVLIDSDGDITLAGPWFEEAGIEGVLPLERQAGVDLARLRAAHPRMRFIGHFDKMTMPHGEAAMRAEFERLLPTAAKGGFFPSCDHQTPPGVSLENYRIYLALFREYAEKAGAMSRKTL